jgi:hypothetical protein
MFGAYPGELTSSLSLESRQLGQPIRQLGQMMPVQRGVAVGIRIAAVRTKIVKQVRRTSSVDCEENYLGDFYDYRTFGGAIAAAL